MDNQQERDSAEEQANRDLMHEDDADTFELGETVRFGDHLARVIAFETGIGDQRLYQVSVNDVVWTQIPGGQLAKDSA